MTRILVASLFALVLVAGCQARGTFAPIDPDLNRMLVQPRYDDYATSPFFANGMAMRRPPSGTRPYAPGPADPALDEGMVDGQWVDRIPLAITLSRITHGRDHFEATCAACHGMLGNGDSPVADRMTLRKPPSLHEPRIRQMAPGFIYRVVTDGWGLMPSYRYAARPGRALGGGGLREGPRAEPARRGRRPAGRRAARPREGGAVRRGFILGGIASAVLGALGLVLSFAASPAQAAHAYLSAFVFAFTTACGGLFLVMITTAVGARWFAPMRRQAETVAGTLPFVVLLVAPVLVWRRHLYPWAGDWAGLSHHDLALLRFRGPWLSSGFFCARAVVYVAVLVALEELLRHLSARQDRQGERAEAIAHRMKAWATGGLFPAALALTFAAFDWTMSLETTWYSTIYGIYFFAGGFVAAIALTAILTSAARARGVLPEGVTGEHLSAIGRLMFAFTIFWAYAGFSQYLLVWIADMPDEVRFFIPRTSGGWYGAALFLIFGHFFLPWFLLLFKGLKRRGAALSAVAAWIVLAHLVDAFWLVMPALHPRGFAPSGLDVAALAAVVGSAVAFGAWRAGRLRPHPVHDPFMAEALRYEQP